MRGRRGSIAIESLLIAAVGLYFLIMAGRAVMAYGEGFAEDADRIFLMRATIEKIYSAVEMLDSCADGSVTTLMIYVPYNSTLRMWGNTIEGNVYQLSREYRSTGGRTYVYRVSLLRGNFKGTTELAHGWNKIRLVKEGGKVKTEVIWRSVR